MENSLPQDLVIVEVNGESRIDSRFVALILPDVSPVFAHFAVSVFTKGNRETPKGKEKRLELEFGKSLTNQCIDVKHQVKCAHGIADIVTDGAIYEIKASLSRSNIFRAASQVLLYRSCINPEAKAIVVGYPHPEEPVDTDFVASLGVEIIVCEDTGETHKMEANACQKDITYIDFEYALQHPICIHEVCFSGVTSIRGYMGGYADPVTIIRNDTAERAEELRNLVENEPWCKAILLRDGRLADYHKRSSDCPCSIALGRKCQRAHLPLKSKEDNRQLDIAERETIDRLWSEIVAVHNPQDKRAFYKACRDFEGVLVLIHKKNREEVRKYVEQHILPGFSK